MLTIFRALLAAYGERCGELGVGEKTPGHTKFIPELLACFPESRFVVLHRDPRAVVASQLKASWARSQMSPLSFRNGIMVRSRLSALAFYASNWRNVYERLVPAVAGGSRVAVFSYERLVLHSEPVLREICAFIGGPFERAMLAERSGASVPEKADGMSRVWQDWLVVHNRQASAPVSTKSLDAWRSERTGLEVALIEGCCAACLYRAECPHVGQG